MDINVLNEVIACLSEGRTLYHYGRDQYALDLIRHRVSRFGGSMKICDIKKTELGMLLNKPIFKPVIANAGDGYIREETLDHEDAFTFVLTVSTWGEKQDYLWDQTSRPGSNLVLQINLINKDAKKLERVLGESANDYAGYSHPVSEHRDATLAWVRMDMDFDTDEVLIEEVQSDLIRDVAALDTMAARAQRSGNKVFKRYSMEYDTEQAYRCCQQLLNQYKGIWAEAALNAAIWFIKNELGFNTIYYHSAETGKVLKNIDFGIPPRSLYTDLPRKFCFTKSSTGPMFICQNKKAKRRLKVINNPTWFSMRL